MPSAPGSVGSRTSARIAPSGSSTSPSVLVAPMSRPTAQSRRSPLPPGLSQQFGHGGCPRAGVATRADPGHRAAVRSGPAPLDHDGGDRRARPGSPGGGARRAPAGRPAGRRSDAQPARRTGRAAGPTGPRRSRCWRRSRRSRRSASVRSGSSPSTDQRPAGTVELGARRRRRTRRGSPRSSSIRSIRATASSSRGPRQPARPARPRRSRPASRAPATPGFSGPDAEQVGSGGQGQHGRLRDAATGGRAGHVEGVADDDAVVPEPVPQQPQHRGAQGAGELGVEGGYDDVRGHHRGDPGLDGRREGHQLARGQGRQVGVDRGQLEVAVLRRCRRGPGSAWRRRRPRPPAARSPRRRRGRRRAAGSVPKLRVPMTGLSGWC